MADDPRLHAFSELTDSPTDELVEQDIAEDDPAVIFYTSGTTGRPKGAISTHRSMIANLQNTMFNAVAGSMAGGGALPNADTGQNVALFTSPLFHVSGCHSTLVVGLLAGLKLVMPEGRFTPETALELIQEHGVTVWATVPTMVWRVCEHPDRHAFDTTSVRSVAFGGSPSADELQRMIRETFPKVTSTSNAYGLTETSSVATVISGQDALDWAAAYRYDLAILDIVLGGMSGLEVCAELRRTGFDASILMLTALGSVEDRVDGLDRGADDYLAKPFALAEVRARVRALGRRTAPAREPILSVHDLELDPATLGVRRGGRPIRLTAREFSLLELLARHPGQLFPQERLLDALWEAGYAPESNVVEVYIRSLRRKVDDGRRDGLIETVRGAGYRIRADAPRP